MEDVDYGKSKRLVSEMGSPVPQNQPSPSKFYSHFLYKSVLVAVLLVILPLFPSQAPESINQTVLTRNWELLHLLFVGIVVSYGLFSRRNVETEKENQSKFDTAQNYVSTILQVSSVFDDEVESPYGSDENKIQTWNCRHFRGEPMVSVEQERSFPDEQVGTITKISNKPLDLPVRSLRSRISDSDALESIHEPRRSSGSLSRSSSGSMGSSNSFDKTRRGGFGVVDSLDLEKKLNESVVLPSPVPWGSRPGRMEMKEEVSSITPPPYSLPPSAEEAEFDRFRSRSFRSPGSSPRPTVISSSLKNPSPSHSLSPELRGKSAEDLGRKKGFYMSSPPPAPPPPPPPPPRPPISHEFPVIKSNSNPVSNGLSSERREMKRSVKDELKDLSRSSRDDLPSRGYSGLDAIKSEVKSRTHKEGSSTGKSARTTRVYEPVTETRKTSKRGGERTEDNQAIRSMEVEAVLMEKTGRKVGGFDPQPVTPKPPPLSKNQMEVNEELSEKVIVEADEDSDGEVDDIQGSSDNEGAASNIVSEPDPSEVDKKAAEFIAKFREQIRLQRIESIKRASGQLSRRTTSR